MTQTRVPNFDAGGSGGKFLSSDTTITDTEATWYMVDVSGGDVAITIGTELENDGQTIWIVPINDGSNDVDPIDTESGNNFRNYNGGTVSSSTTVRSNDIAFLGTFDATDSVWQKSKITETIS